MASRRSWVRIPSAPPKSAGSFFPPFSSLLAQSLRLRISVVSASLGKNNPRTSENGCIILHIRRVARRLHGHRQSTCHRDCLGTASGSFEPAGAEAFRPRGGERVFEDSRTVGIAR